MRGRIDSERRRGAIATLADNIPGRTGPHRAALSPEQRTLLAGIRQAQRTAEEAKLVLERAVADAWLAGIALAEIGRSLGYGPRNSATMAAGRLLDRELTRRRSAK